MACLIKNMSSSGNVADVLWTMFCSSDGNYFDVNIDSKYIYSCMASKRE
jgi:hypothetical protein